MALIASTCIGNADSLRGARSGVVVAVRTQGGDPPVGQEQGGRGVEARLRLRGVPRLELGLAPRVTRADEQDVADVHGHTLRRAPRPRGPRGTRGPRLHPANPAHAGHVEQNAAADQPVLEDVDRPGLRAELGDRRSGLPSKSEAIEGDVAEGVDVAVALVVVVDARRSPWRSARIPTRCRRRAASSCGGRRAPERRSRASVFSGWLSVIVTPLRTSRAAAATRSGVRWLSAPRSPSSSQRPQLETESKSSRNSCAVKSTPGMAASLRDCVPERARIQEVGLAGPSSSRAGGASGEDAAGVVHRRSAAVAAPLPSRGLAPRSVPPPGRSGAGLRRGRA